jgi:hypothetical protein
MRLLHLVGSQLAVIIPQPARDKEVHTQLLLVMAPMAVATAIKAVCRMAVDNPVSSTPSASCKHAARRSIERHL